MVALVGVYPAFAGFYYGDGLNSFCQAGMAMPYVAGVYDAWEFAKIAGADGAEICLPPGAQGQQITKAACSYVEQLSADELKSSAALIVLAGLAQTFPCN